jgi:hypothetical protein
MSKYRLFFLLYWILTFVFALFTADVSNTLGVENYYSFQKYWFGLGLILFLIGWMWESSAKSSMKSEISRLEAQNMEFKAKLYDKSEEEKKEQAKLKAKNEPANADKDVDDDEYTSDD